jgi:hypothetical protein
MSYNYLERVAVVAKTGQRAIKLRVTPKRNEMLFCNP